jgi:hypothetical protein
MYFAAAVFFGPIDLQVDVDVADRTVHTLIPDQRSALKPDQVFLSCHT